MQFADYFRTAMQECAAAQDELMGEIVTVTPMVVRPNFPAERAGSGASVNVVAIFTWVSETAFMSNDAKRNSHARDIETTAPLMTTRKPRFSIKANLLPWPILRGYRITRCTDSTQWDVTAVKPDGASRIECDVVQLGRHSQ